MSHRIRISLFLTLACFSFLIFDAPPSYAVQDNHLDEIYPGDGGCDDCPPPDGEGGDPEEILIRSRPAPPVDDGMGLFDDKGSRSELLILLVNLVRSLR